MTTNEQAASATNTVQQSSGDLFGYEVDIEAVGRALARRLIPSPPSASCISTRRTPMTTNEQAASATDTVQQSSGDLFGYEMNIDAMGRALIIMPRLLALSNAADATPAALDELRDRVRSLTVEVGFMSDALACLRAWVDGLPVDERDSNRRHLYGSKE